MHLNDTPPIINFVDFLRSILQQWSYEWRDLADKCNGAYSCWYVKRSMQIIPSSQFIDSLATQFEFYVQDSEKEGQVNL